MDSVFELSNGDRVSYLVNLMQSFGCSYVCLWTCSLDHNILYCEVGYYQDDATSQLLASSSSGSVARRLFEEYKESVFTIGNVYVPGLAFKNRNPYLELHESDLLRLASVESQRRFYKEARIKIALFLGCERGEIELGMAYIPQMSSEVKMQTLFPQDFARLHDSSPMVEIQQQQQQQQQQNRTSPTSSVSLDSPEYSSLLYTCIPTSSPYLQEQSTTKPQTLPHFVAPEINPSVTGLNNQQQGISFLSSDTTDAALTRAYLAVLSSPPPSSVLPSQPTSGQQSNTRTRPSAFTRYLGSSSVGSQRRTTDMRRQTMFKRSIAYFRGLNYRRMQEQGNRPSNSQLHHMISERKRREKLNESFQALRSFLPPGTKKDKATVLRTTKEYLASLKAQLAELSKRNQLLEAQLVPRTKETTTQAGFEVATDQRLNVSIAPVSTVSTSTGRMVDLQVILRRPTRSISDSIVRVLEFLNNQVREASLVSMEAQTHQILDQGPTNWVTFRLRIEGTEWDELAFVEAVQRILAEFAQ